jgi:GAF domain-containing protein
VKQQEPVGGRAEPDRSGGETPEARALEAIAVEIRRRTGARRSAIVFGEEDNSQIRFSAASGPGAERLIGAHGPTEGSGLCGNVLTGGCSILSERTLGDPRVRQDHVRGSDIDTALGVPVRHGGRTFAVLMALGREDSTHYTQTDQRALEHYAAEVAEQLWRLHDARG